MKYCNLCPHRYGASICEFCDGVELPDDQITIEEVADEKRDQNPD